MVDAIESHMSHWTALQHLLQTAVLGLAVAGGATLLLTGYRFVLEPVSQLKRAIERLQAGDFGARVSTSSSDEFGTLAAGFNDLAEHLQSLYQNLEAKVAEKTSELQDKGRRLQALYDMSTLVEQASTLDELARGFTRHVAQVAQADGVALRWSDERNERYLMLASHGLPASMTEDEQCLKAGDCHCGIPSAAPGVRVIPIHALPRGSMEHCARADFETVVALPIRQHERDMGELDLFYNAQITPSQAERSLLEALVAHLAAAMENLRLDSLAKEAAVSHERNLLARELHDSIAQSLAFLKIQVQLMRDALRSGDPQRVQAVLGEIDEGVRESYGDVRELLLHFRTRANAEQIEPALQTTLRKFEHQSGIKASLQMQGQGLPLSPDLQIQVLHIVQEALSNVRKHARASQVWLDVQQQPHWRFEVRDDGIGFDAEDPARGESHVGLRIMAERAERIGARLELLSTPGRGSSVVLELAPVDARTTLEEAVAP
jgi:two-component system nitrate/nitrite sensor histidine kinase NarX